MAVRKLVPDTDADLEWERWNEVEQKPVLVDGQCVTVSIKTLTPAVAERLLRFHNSINRSLSAATVNRLRADMLDGLYRFNGSTIIISEDGELLDGQHRCKAVVESATAVPVLVVRGIQRDAMSTIDQGRHRSVKDILDTAGPTAGGSIPNANQVNGTASLLMQASRQYYKDAGNRARIAAYVQNNLEQLVPVASWAKSVCAVAPQVEIRAYSDGRRCMSPSPLAALVLVMEKHGGNSTEVRAFFERLADQRMARDGSEYQSLRTTRSWLIRSYPLIREGGTQLPRLLQVYGALINVYNRLQQGDPVQKIHLGKPIRFLDELPTVRRD